MSSQREEGATSVKRYVKKLSIADLKKRGVARCFNFEVRGGRLVRALRFKNVGPLNENILDLIGSEDTAYAVVRGGTVRDVFTNKQVILAYTARGALTYATPSGQRCDLIYGDGGVTKVDAETGETERLKECGKAQHAAIFHERLFLADGSLLTYSAPLDCAAFSLEKQDTGRIELSEVGGDILALIPFEGRLAVFRSHEILLLTASASDLYFAFERLDFDEGEICAGSVRSCGENILFFTSRGLYCLRGKTCTRISLWDEGLTLTTPAVTIAHDGRYFAAAMLDGKTPCMLVYDPVAEDHFLALTPPTMLAECRRGVFLKTDEILVFIGEVADSPFNYSSAWFEFELLERSSQYVIEGVTAAGKGKYTLSIEADYTTNGKEYSIDAYEKAMLRHTLRAGKLRIVLHTFDEDAELDAIALHLREVGA